MAVALYERQRCPATGYGCIDCPNGRCAEEDAEGLVRTVPVSNGQSAERVITVIDLGTGQEMGDIAIAADRPRTKVFDSASLI